VWPLFQKRGVLRDYAEAVDWLRKAADLGHAVAQCNLGFAYTNGRGVDKDDAQAVLWYRKAAEQGQADAQRSLGEMCAKGLGVSQDYIEAYKWTNLAALRAFQSADQKQFADERDNLAKRMSLAQVAEAQKRADEWLAAHEKPQH
jgi:uncharacterized protein